MRTLRYRSLAGAAALALATFGLAGCGSNESKDQDAAAQSAVSTPQESSAATSESPKLPELTQDNFLERTTNAMLKAKYYRVDVVSGDSEGSAAFGGDFIASEDPSEKFAYLAIPIDASGTQMETLQVSGKMYTRLPQTQGKWLPLDDSVPGFEGISSGLTQGDILSKMKSTGPAILDFTAEPDSETIDGVSTTKLVTELDAQQYMGAKWDSTIGDTVTMTYFVGPDDLIRRTVLELGPSTVTMDMSLWGERFEVEAPPAEELITFEEMSKQQG
ncbi:MAG: hypothetical protein QM705_07410 [Ancrocorticia sp.]